MRASIVQRFVSLLSFYKSTPSSWIKVARENAIIVGFGRCNIWRRSRWVSVLYQIHFVFETHMALLWLSIVVFGNKKSPQWASIADMPFMLILELMVRWIVVRCVLVLSGYRLVTWRHLLIHVSFWREICNGLIKKHTKPNIGVAAPAAWPVRRSPRKLF